MTHNPITCNALCFELATRGGIFEHKSGTMTAHPVYYYCDRHVEKLNGATETWGVS